MKKNRITCNPYFLAVMPVFIFIMVFVGITQCNAAEPSISIGLTGEPRPLVANDWRDVNTAIVTRTIFEKLLFADKSMNIKPCLATSWDIAEQGAITFNLRKGVTFHDGTPFNADAVKFTLDRTNTDKLIHRRLFSSITEIEIIDDYTVKMHIKGSPNTVLATLAIYGLIESPASVKKYGKKDVGLHPAGTGPYKLSEWVPDQKLVLEANDAYWGGKPKISQVVFTPVPDSQSRVSMLEAGNLDIALSVPITEVDRLDSLPNITVSDDVTGNVFFLIFNTVKEPFTDKRVRQAVSYAIDRKGIIKALLFGRLPVGTSYGAPGVKHVPTYDIYPYNPEKSRSILAELGWKKGNSGFLEKDGTVFRTGLITTSGRAPMDRQIAEAIQAQLKKIDIDLKVIVLESGAFNTAVMSDLEAKKKAEFGMLMRGLPMGPDPDNAFNMRFHSTAIPPNGTNVACFVNATLDNALETGAREIDDAKRAAAYKTVQDILHEEIPWLPIFTMVNFNALKKGVTGAGAANPFFTFYVSVDARKQ